MRNCQPVKVEKFGKNGKWTLRIRWEQWRWFIDDRFRWWSRTSAIMRRVSHIYGDTRTYVPLVKHAGNNAASSVWLPLFQSAGERTERQRPRNTSRDRAIDLQECVTAYVRSPSFNCTWGTLYCLDAIVWHIRWNVADSNLFKWIISQWYRTNNEYKIAKKMWRIPS